MKARLAWAGAGALLWSACAPRAGVAAAPRAALPPPTELRCPILMYHRIGAPPAGEAATRQRLYSSWPRFRSHLDLLRRSGYGTVTFQDLAAVFSGARPVPARPVVLTFDDGTADHWAVHAELKRRRMSAVFFVVAERLGTPGHLDPDQLRTMAGAGMEIGSHGRRHLDLGRVTASELEAEIAGSRRELEALAGRPVLAFAYPGGAYDGSVVATAAAAGYAHARTTQSGMAIVRSRELALPAIHVHEETTARDLERLLRDGPAAPCPICGI